MLSELAARFEAEKKSCQIQEEEIIDMSSMEESALVRYSSPPNYVPIYPSAPSVQPASELSLSILNNAMTNNTGATNAQKEEKCAYGAMAEAFRDSTTVQHIKLRVNTNILPRLQHELTGKKRKRFLVHSAMLGSAAVAALTSVSSLVKDINIVIPSKTNGTNTPLEIPSWFASFSTVFNLINLVATGAMMACARIERSLDCSIAMLRKEIMKKQSYNDAVRMSVQDGTDVAKLLEQAEGVPR
ncbi:NS3 [Tilligerry virus]|uniref:NS3 n=1 Tax=Tilligerry virus TaxID=1170505 RepID=H9ZXR1_9REOV|nr:NS3 [Tilligerry virus]